MTLGKSNLYRAISGSLISLGVTSKRTIDDMVFGGLENIKKNNDEVASHFYHLRYLYELTGACIIDSNCKISRVKYLIYNDPHGNIYVKSTADIVANILDAKVSASEGFKTIKIKKSIFD